MKADSRVDSAGESAKQDSDAIRRISGWAESSIWTPRMLAALEHGVEGGKWFSLIDKVARKETLEIAWRKVRKNRGACGVDKMSVGLFERQADKYLSEMSEAIMSGSYMAEAVRRVEITKGGGKMRPLGIPTVKDRIVQMAVKLVLEPIFERRFKLCSYGFRPGRSAKDARNAVETFLELGYHHVLDADLKGYFDSIPHERLMQRVKESVADGKVLALLEQWLKQDIVSEAARWTPSQGTPQGTVISPLLANLYLHHLDEHLMNKGYRIVRYADDFVIPCRSKSEASEAMREVENWVAENSLALNPDKTHIADCRNEGEGFDFLGYHYEGYGRDVRKKSLDAFKNRIRELTPRRTSGQSLEKTIAYINPVIKGWFNYFKDAKRQTLERLDRMIRRRLRAMLRHRTKRKGQGHTLDDHRQWTNTFFSNIRLFSLNKAWILYRRS